MRYNLRKGAKTNSSNRVTKKTQTKSAKFKNSDSPKDKNLQSTKIAKVKMEEIHLNIDSLINSFPNFDGKKNTNIKKFISDYELLATSIKIPDNLKLIFLKSKLVGYARDKINEDEEISNENNYEQFKIKIIEALQKDANFEEAQLKFMKICQSPNQNIKDFAVQFKTAANNYLKASGHQANQGSREFLETIKLSKFLDSVRPDIGFEIRKMAPKDFDQALKLAIQIENAYNANSKEEANNLNSAKNEGIYRIITELQSKHEAEINDLKNELKKCQIHDKESSQSNRKIYCEICKKSNHELEKCWYNKKSYNAKPEVKNKSRGYSEKRGKQFTFQGPGQYAQNVQEPWQAQSTYQNHVSQNFPNYANGMGNYWGSPPPQFSQFNPQATGYARAEFEKQQNERFQSTDDKRHQYRERDVQNRSKRDYDYKNKGKNGQYSGNE